MESGGSFPKSSLDVRRRRLRIRARQRGTLEICVLLERFMKTSPLTRESEITGLERLLEETDQDIEMWLSGSARWPRRHVRVLAAITHALGLPAAYGSPCG